MKKLRIGLLSCVVVGMLGAQEGSKTVAQQNAASPAMPAVQSQAAIASQAPSSLSSSGSASAAPSLAPASPAAASAPVLPSDLASGLVLKDAAPASTVAVAPGATPSTSVSPSLPVATPVPGIPVPVISIPSGATSVVSATPPVPHGATPGAPAEQVAAPNKPLDAPPASVQTPPLAPAESAMGAKAAATTPDKKEVSPLMPQKVVKKEPASDQEVKEHIKALKEVSSQGDEEEDEGPDTMKAPHEKIGFRGNWVKKREWLLQARNEKIKIQNAAQEIRAQRTQFWGKYKISQDEFDEFYKAVGELRGKIEAHLARFDVAAHAKKGDEKRKIDEKQKAVDVKRNEQAQIMSEQAPEDETKKRLEGYKTDFANVLAAYKQVSEFDGALTKRMEKLDEQVEIANKKEGDASTLYDEMWDIIDDDKARGVFYQITVFKSDIDGVLEYIKGLFIQDFDTTLANARAHTEKVRNNFLELEKKVSEFLKPATTTAGEPEKKTQKADQAQGVTAPTFISRAKEMAWKGFDLLVYGAQKTLEFIASYDWAGLWKKVVSVTHSAWQVLSSYAYQGYSYVKGLTVGDSSSKKEAEKPKVDLHEQQKSVVLQPKESVPAASESKPVLEHGVVDATVPQISAPAPMPEPEKKVEAMPVVSESEPALEHETINMQVPQGPMPLPQSTEKSGLAVPSDAQVSDVGEMAEPEKASDNAQKIEKKGDKESKEGEKDEKSLVNSTIKGMINDEYFRRRWMSLDEDANQA